MQKQKRGVVQRPQEITKNFRSFRLHSADKIAVLKQFYHDLDTPISLSCYLLLQYQEYEQLVHKEIDPVNYEDPDLFRRDFAAISFLRKNQFLKTGIDTKQAALSSFEKAEQQCRYSNLRIKSYLQGKQKTSSCEAAIHAAIRKIDRILGKLDIDELLEVADWGPGVSLTVKGKDTSRSRKFDCDNSITAEAYSIFGELAQLAYPNWEAWKKPAFVNANAIITVPKNAKTDRTIAIEPGLNLWFQKAIGRQIRRRMGCCGFNLNSDTKNHRGAYIGSYDNSLTTVDFSSASDTICIETVRLLLPNRWFIVLDALRSHNFCLDSSVRRFHKFSSMGNGFTWELESLIFSACALACCEVLGLDDSKVSVFGDDIIIPTEAYVMYTDLVEFLGFTINKQKSYNSTYFRESCGSFYFKGVDVKPIFVRSDFTQLQPIYVLLNRMRDFAHRCNNTYGCDIRLQKSWRKLLSYVPSNLRFFGPIQSGDSTIHDNMEACKGVKVAGNGWEGFSFPAIVMRPRYVEKDTLGVLIAKVSLHRQSCYLDRTEGNLIALRGIAYPTFKKRMICEQWYELGPWI